MHYRPTGSTGSTGSTDTHAHASLQLLETITDSARPANSDDAEWQELKVCYANLVQYCNTHGVMYDKTWQQLLW